MKWIKTFGFILGGFLLGLGFDSLQQPTENPADEKNVLRASLEEARQTADKTSVQRDRLQNEIDQLRASVGEIHRLRADVSRLSRELDESRAQQEQMARAATRTPAAKPTPENAVLPKHKIAESKTGIAIENAPLAVQDAMRQVLGNQPINGVLASSVDNTGRISYGFKGQTADQRSIVVRLAEDGSILERSVEIPADALPTEIQAPAAQVFGDMPISAAREIVEGDKRVYELSAKGPQSGMQAMIRDDGTLVSYSARWRQVDGEQPKQKR